MPFADEFPLEADVVYLNHAAVSPWPARTAAAVKAFANENVHRGAQYYPRWLEVEQRLRERLQRLIGARSSGEIALLKSTSEGLSVIAQGLDWQPGDKVIIPSGEFPSNRIVWEALSRYGVEVQPIDLYSGTDPEQALIAAIDDRTRLVSVSSVQFDTGLRLDLKRIGLACESAGSLFCVDAIQSLGAIPLDVRNIRADFVVADGHKWLLGPEGLALFYCRRELLDRLRLYQFGWHMIERVYDFERRDWQPATSARRFECGSPNMLGAHALDASLSLLEDLGIDAIAERVLDNTGYLFERLAERTAAYRTVTPSQSDRHAGIFSFVPLGEEVQAVHQRLQADGVVCAVRNGALRFSPHFYTSRDCMDRALALL